MASADHDGAPPSQVRLVLAGGRRDLWRANLPSFLNPVRDYLLDPALIIWTTVLPPLAGLIKADESVARVVDTVSMTPFRFFLRMVSSSDTTSVRSTAKNDLLNGSTGLPRIQPPSDLNSAVRGAFAFTCSAAADVIGAFIDPQKMKKWMSSLGQFRAFLHSSGVGTELEESMMKPLFRGRLLDNIKILNDIQEMKDEDRAARSRDPKFSNITKELELGHRFMRFATAAYGTEMIRSALDNDAMMHEIESEKKAIAFHCKIQPDDVRYLHVLEGGDMKVLRHFIAVDHFHKQIVMALRGTLSISGALVDIQAMDCEYCNGKAHTGIAEMADHLWNASGPEVEKLTQEFPEYEFVVVGHSLGAGCSCLLHVKLHMENLLPKVVKKCFGFAPPPTFCLDHTCASSDCVDAVQRAIDNCICYIHDNDCVPFLSVASIRRLSNLLDAVDNKTEHVWFWKRFRIFWEFDAIPDELVESVVKAGVNGNESALPGELMIPAKVVVWMKKNFVGKFEAYGCSPQAVAALNIFMCNDMMTDHLPEQYEDAFDALTANESGVQ